jgi:parvulin-like peptidyl-prolyl isomerase
MKFLPFFVFVLCFGMQCISAPLKVEGVVAYVNDSVITMGEVKEMIAPAIPELQQNYQGEEFKTKLQELHKGALEDLVTTRLIIKAYDADTKINKAAVEKHVEDKVSEFIQDRFNGDRQEFMNALQSERMPMEEWRRRLRERVIVGLMRNREVDSHVIISPRDVRKVYEQDRNKYQRQERVKLRIILVRGATNETDRAVREQHAKDIQGKLSSGAEFSEMARQYSEDPSSAKGGEWGWMAVSDLRRELASVVASLDAGRIGGVMMDGDYYLMKVAEREKAGVIPFEEVRNAIEKDLRRKESRRLFALWIERLKKDAYIEIVDTAIL